MFMFEKAVMGGRRYQVLARFESDSGIDNSWGKNILPIWTGIAADFSQQINDGVTNGEFTYLIHIDDLGDQANYVNLTARGYAGSDRGSPPLFN